MVVEFKKFLKGGCDRDLGPLWAAARSAMLQAIVYRRVSSRKQRGNSSFDRQDGQTDLMCLEEGWPIIDAVDDDGVSAFTGKNINSGSLATFIRRCEVEGGQGLVLVVECQDRLSRVHELDFFEWFLKVLRTGLTIAFADNRMVVDLNSFRNQKRQMRRIIDDAEEAARYPERLGSRVRAAVQDRRDDGLPVHCRSTCPAWLELTPCRKRFLTDTPRSLYRIALINELFDLRIGGMGYARMARFLNARGEPTWRGGNGWGKSALRAILSGRSVLGEYQHHVRREPIGDVIPDYFPQIVSNDKWQAANNAGHRKIMASHSRASKLTNLLSDIARCAACGSRMLFRNKSRKANGQPVAYLQCDNASRSLGCASNKMMRYYPLEEQVLDALLTKALDDQHFQNDDEVGQINRRIADQRRLHDDVQKRVTNCVESIERFADKPSLMTQFEVRLRTADLELDEIRKVLDALSAQLERARGRASRAEHVKRVDEIRADLRSADDVKRTSAALLIKAALNDFVEVLHVSGDGSRAPIDGLAGMIASRVPHHANAVLAGGIGVAFFDNGDEPTFFELLKRRASLDSLPSEQRRVVSNYLRRVE